MQTVLVTGAAGTVGNYVVGLAEAAGYRVIASDLNPQRIAMPVRGEIRPGDLRDPRFLHNLVRGVDHVIHTAAVLDAGAAAPEFSTVNTQAVIDLYRAAAAAGACRFVHVSTAMLYATGQSGPLVENCELRPRGLHGHSKHAGEQGLIEEAAKIRGPEWTIVRPAPVYGRRGRHFAAILLVIAPVLRLLTPMVPRFRGGPVATFVHAEDVARALVFLLGKSESVGQIYNVADEHRLALGDRVTETYRAYGIPTLPLGDLPRAALDRLPAAFSSDTAHQLLDQSLLTAWRLVVLRHRLKPALRPRLDLEAMSLLNDDLIVDSAKLRSLGWRPRFPSFIEGWRQVLRWYQAERWVPRFG